MNPNVFLETLKSLDLEYSLKTGGSFKEVLCTSGVKTCGPREFRAYLPDGDRVRFIEPHLFLKTIRLAEEKLDLKLFR